MAAALLFGSGCFSFRPAELDLVPVGQDVRVRLTRQAAAELPELPEQNGTTVRGRLMRKDGGELLLRVPVAVQQEGALTRELGRDVAIPAAGIVVVERRELHPGRTALAVAAGLGVVAVLLQEFGDVRNEDPAEFPEPPAESVKIPWFTARFR